MTSCSKKEARGWYKEKLDVPYYQGNGISEIKKKRKRKRKKKRIGLESECMLVLGHYFPKQAFSLCSESIFDPYFQRIILIQISHCRLFVTHPIKINCDVLVFF